MLCGQDREGVWCLLAPTAYKFQGKTEHRWTICLDCPHLCRQTDRQVWKSERRKAGDTKAPPSPS